MKRQKSLPVGLIVFAVAIFIFIAVAACVGVLVWSNKQPATGTASHPSKIYSRPDFERAIKGKTKAQITALLGKPTDTTGGEWDNWSWRDITRDPVTGKIDFFVSIVFSPDGIVSDCHFGGPG
jgi:hypothetical protein